MSHAPILSAVAALLLVAAPSFATEVWSGRTHTFTKADNADWTLAANQDHITDNVWLTRAATKGLFNIASESGYVLGSPAGTEWATGNAVDHASLAFQSWLGWAADNPPATVGVNAVVHLIADDVYLDIRIDSWTQGFSGGGFSYTRAERPTTSVVPGSAAFALRGMVGNPAGAGTPVEFTLPDAAPARLEVFDAAGRSIAVREVGSLGAGSHRLVLAELRTQPPGLLFVRLTRAGRSLVSRSVHLR